MKKKAFIIIILSVTAVVLVSGIVVQTVFNTKDAQALSSDIAAEVNGSPITSNIEKDNSERDLTYTYTPPILEDNRPNPKPVDTDTTLEEPFVPATKMDLDPSSITVFVNKEHSIPKDYKPKDMVVPDIYFNLTYYDERTLLRKEAAAAIERLFLAAKNEGYFLSGISGYRSYERQYKIFTDNIVIKGKDHTLKYSAVPGTSEHQTGLAMDLSCESLDYELSSAFANTPEGKWLAENSHRYGYIIRYPKGKSKITGYAYEPWHIRYVGKELAAYLYKNVLTLEDYYSYKPSKDFDFETLYSDLINYSPSVTPPVNGEGFVLGENGEIIDIELGEEVEIPDGEGEPVLETPGNTEEEDLDSSEDTAQGSDDENSSDGDNEDSSEEYNESDHGDNTDTDELPDTGNDTTTGGEGGTPTPIPTSTPTPTPPPTPIPTPDPGNIVTSDSLSPDPTE